MGPAVVRAAQCVLPLEEAEGWDRSGLSCPSAVAAAGALALAVLVASSSDAKRISPVRCLAPPVPELRPRRGFGANLHSPADSKGEAKMP